MDGMVLAALITAAATLMTSLGALFLAWRSGPKTAAAVTKLELQINSRMSQFMELLEKSAKAAGAREEANRRDVSEAQKIIAEDATVKKMTVEEMHVGEVKREPGEGG